MTSHGLGKQVSSASQPQRAGPRLTPRWRPLGQRSEQAPLAGHASEDAAPVSDGCEGRSVAAAAAPAAAGAGQVQYASLLCVPPLIPATDSDANGQDSGPDVAMTLPEPCLPLRQKSELQQHEQQRNLQSGHSPTEQSRQQGSQLHADHSLPPRQQPRQSGRDYSSRQCRQCRTCTPGSGADAAWQAHPTTGQRWLCQPCFSEAQRTTAQQNKEQDSRQRRCLQCGTSTPGVGTAGSKGERWMLAFTRAGAFAAATL